MIFRFLPNSINSRKNVLEKAHARANSQSLAEMVLMPPTLDKLNISFPKFIKEFNERNIAFSEQAAFTTKENRLQHLLQMCISHFIQGLNFRIQRGIYKPAIRLLYNLELNTTAMPETNTEQSLITVATNLINGEQARSTNRNNGDTSIPMCNPDIKELQTVLNRYKEVTTQQSEAKTKFFNENKDVLDMLPETDKLIKRIYNEVELFYSDLEPSQMRRNAREWGIIYYTRDGETPEEGCITEEELNNM